MGCNQLAVLSINSTPKRFAKAAPCLRNFGTDAPELNGIDSTANVPLAAAPGAWPINLMIPSLITAVPYSVTRACAQY
jgi:hypothetical protein